ncbi:dipeptidase [Paenibacillus sp. HN-1]|uniref:dipeptidase n=1 Tax=Paenibacillus TaxID=44249 RepID=UPI001CA972E8|nr:MULTISPECIES: dipeptidase [Paenibacillus]MBY9078489.1 dipeptidase [Paenibacillus sp. CGMCC 1.18879]MBY9082782.1 dipeptidase [Paenibacillus sinensis]
MSTLTIDGCIYSEGGFEGCSEEVLQSRLNAFFLTLSSFDGFAETVRGIGKIYDFADKEEHRLSVARTYDDLELAAKAGKKSVILTFQEPYPIGDSLNNLRVFYELGVRVVQLTYNKANYIGTGCTESRDRGLTDFGRRVIAEMNRLGMLVDVSHCSRDTVIDAIKASSQPIVFSHANVKQISSNPRNKTDEEIKLLAENGGVMGLTPWAPICWTRKNDEQPSLDDYLDHVEYVIKMVGIDHVGFGGDCTPDGKSDESGTIVQATMYPQVAGDYYTRVGTDYALAHAKGFDGVKDIDNVVRGLEKRGYGESDIEKFLGGNFARVIKQVWK